ncbi:DNA recombination protein RmuC [Bacteroides sp. OF04-15BH]|uniref:DNA recombination protein RmuC n=1 Tax=Bacteroides sp. OF04-15BH TaxID=2292281 RepID=UPI000E4A423C|nr:DNA recombination protein RmuC [Bacteroides sp. OF04-15BH]RHP62415.1 DNA recombination protein RmuC [Bacteroides sp. OF04-15BH]
MTESIIFLFIGILGGFAAGWLLQKSRNGGMLVQIAAKDSELERERQLYQLEQERSKQRERELEQRLTQMNEENKELRSARAVSEKEIELLRRQIALEEEAGKERLKEQMDMVRQQMQNATQEMLKQRSNELSEHNQSQMSALLTPLKQSISEMKQTMESNRDVHNRNTASLEKAIEEMMKRTVDIGKEADKLAHALRNESKTQGNWGELILDDLLCGQGLKEGLHYEKQVTLRDGQGRALRNEESGKKMIPDTILHYPDGKDAVIDSKVSLTAFVDYQNAETDEERNEALKRHVQSVKQHVSELARKDYSAYIKPPRQSLNYVIMFVPNESALQLALQSEPALWHDAFEKGVFITSEQNLMAALRMIQIAWTQVQQARNQEAIFDTARMLLDRVSDFIKFFDEMGQKLQEAHNCYIKSANKLRDGKQSVVGGANKLIRLGAKTSSNKTLPETNESGIPSQSENAAYLTDKS